MNVLRGKPIKVFSYQDHEAHMMTHQSFRQDPKVMATLGQNPMAQGMMAALMAHEAEHAAFAYRAQVEMALGVPLPALDPSGSAPIAPEDEKALAPLIAAAAQRTMVQNQAMAAQQQAQQMAQDPTLQMQQAELQLKQAEMQRKAQNDQMDFQIAQQKLQLEAQRLQLEAQKNQGEDPRLKAMRAQQELQQKEQVHQQKMRQQMQSDAIKTRQQMMRTQRNKE
jgi:hypothetical protein